MIEKKLSNATPLDDENVVLRRSDKKDFGNASNITEGTLPVSVLPDIPKDKLPEIETDDLPDSGITAGTYTYPTDIVVNSKGQVTSITEGQAGANQDLSNLGPLGLDKINQSKALETGSVSSDADVYADIQKYAHSTFDLSKFTVVGSPTISEDGIMTSCGRLNHLSIPDYDYTKPFCICFSLMQNVNKQTRLFCFNNSDTDIRGEVSGNKFSISFYIDNTIVIGVAGNYILDLNTPYDFKILYTGENYEIYYKLQNDSNYSILRSVASSKTITTNGSSTIGGRAGIYSDFTGSIDLKSIAIWADGIPVFNGNKTGLEIVKPDNYEIVGSPTISEDGIASGFSDSNYIAKENVFSLNENGDFHIDFKFDSEIYSSFQYFIDIYNSINDEIIIRREPNGNIYTCVCFVDGSGVFRESLNSRGHNSIEGYIEYKNGTYTFKLNDSLVARQATKMNALTYKISMGARVASGSILQPLINGSIDLNSIKIYSNGNLVYQPCLKIPYTETFKHSRIVDVAYRHRVQDLAEQKGEALYYTIDEQNQNFTLPMADIYGMITKNRDIAEHADLATQTAYIIKCNVTGTMGYVIYSNGLCEQWGDAAIISGTSVTINLPVPYKNVQFNVQVTDGGDTGGSYRNSYGFYNPSGAQTIIYGVKVGNAFAWRTIGMVNLDEVLTND